ncbi:MAG TPA: LPD29 domain-containing protein [Bacteroidales bacterium]|nr:LPD29 domain-containing protein [Bacteroidales bacterium]
MKKKSIHAQCAAAIRKELKKEFTGVKFSVISDSFAGGNSVDISWTDGPTTKMVEKITKKYQYGHFDGMVDMYEYSNRREDIPQAKYVHTSRDISEKTKQEILEIIRKKYGIENKTENDWIEEHRCYFPTLIHRESVDLNLMEKPEYIDFEKELLNV